LGANLSVGFCAKTDNEFNKAITAMKRRIDLLLSITFFLAKLIITNL
jgi:hypothetical protein